MERFDKKGMMIIPNPAQGEEVASKDKSLLVVELYCPNGHNLVSPRADFNGHHGILVAVQCGGARGLLAISPVFGERSRISIDIDLPNGSPVKYFCPECSVELPAHSPCLKCDGGNLIAFFRTPTPDFNSCVGICNVAGCPNACIVDSGELLSFQSLSL